jgi:hypothetical protein
VFTLEFNAMEDDLLDRVGIEDLHPLESDGKDI